MWEGWRVLRLDIDPATRPDIVACMTSLGAIGPFDAVYCSHALEHLYPHQVPIALGEFHRVLAPGGKLIVAVPDLEGVAPTDDALPGMGDLCGLDLFYGSSREIPERPYMAHHCGFIEATLAAALQAQGFTVETKRMDKHNLLAVGTK
jgi:SAM-dependent methyltransferase